jgi:hypothetical protein
MPYLALTYSQHQTLRQVSKLKVSSLNVRAKLYPQIQPIYLHYKDKYEAKIDMLDRLPSFEVQMVHHE